MAKRAFVFLALLGAFWAPAATDGDWDIFCGTWVRISSGPESVIIFRIEKYDKSSGPFGTWKGQFQLRQGTESGGGRAEFMIGDALLERGQMTLYHTYGKWNGSVDTRTFEREADARLQGVSLHAVMTWESAAKPRELWSKIIWSSRAPM